uniref:Lanthionine biosynthesis protein LanB n=1 Tax=Nonomuraea gerenzanensis TaxID=93944 RepID=A0A1M4E5Z8_9ACTN|nr:lantibiotic dehydratase [Nonomuraea gerenzanensis]SBO94266.1 Lanthionine biosynthesis protein LanB [Nonomuraea gerenzanensis]
MITPRFEHADAAVIRASAFTSRPDLPPWPDLTGTSAGHIAGWLSWLRHVRTDPAFVEAIEVASPILADQIAGVCAGRIQQPHRIQSAVQSTLRYLLRATSRATPFGVFAGVAATRIGDTTNLQRGKQHRALARPDSAWVTALIRRVEAHPGVLPQLPATVNNLVFARGERLVLPCRLAPGQTGTCDLTVRNTAPVQAVMKAARTPIRIGRLGAILIEAFPDHAPHDLDALLAALAEHGILLTSINPPMTVTDPLGHIITELARLPDPPLHLIEELQAIQKDLTHHGRTGSAVERHALRVSATKRMATMCDDITAELAVDLRLDWTAALPRAVATEAEAAASALVQLTPHPQGNPAWQAWHTAFLERWGIDAVVPLTHAVDTDIGIGYPAGYRTSTTTPAAPSLTPRDRTLLRLAQRAALEGGDVVLDETTLNNLATDADRPPHPVPHTELRFALHAPTLTAIDRGEFTLAVLSAARQAGTTAGRFLHLLEPTDRDRLTGTLAALPTLHPGAMLAQVSCPPLSARAANLARSPAITTVVPLGEHQPHSSQTLPLEDLAVSADAHRLFLLSLSRGQLVEPLMVNALDLRRATHPLARFLCEISTARAAACTPFSWGAATGLPFLPRVRYRRTILHPATWNIAATDLPGSRATWPQWEQAWRGHRDHHRIPDQVFLGEDDVRLQLDLTEPAHLSLLRTHLNRLQTATLTEAPSRDAYGWTGGHVHEIVLPLTTAPAKRATPPITRRYRPVHHHGHPPGVSPWLYARLYAHPEAQTHILTDHLPNLLSAWRHGPENGAWFLRHHTPEPHLRLRLPLHNPNRYGKAAQQASAWAEPLRNQGLLRGIVFDTYYPEPGRYGSGPTLTAAEQVFAADSAAVLAQLPLTDQAAPPAAVIAASLTNLTAAFTGSLPAGMDWLIHRIPRTATPAINRSLYDETMRLADPSGDWAAVQALPGGTQAVTAWRRRCHAVTRYRALLTTGHGPNADNVLASLLHLHHARMAGLDADSERLCLRLARAAALAHVHRNNQ